MSHYVKLYQIWKLSLKYSQECLAFKRSHSQLSLSQVPDREAKIPCFLWLQIMKKREILATASRQMLEKFW